MTEWEAERTMIASSVAASNLYLLYMHDILSRASTLEEWIEVHVRQYVGWDYLNYRPLLKSAEAYLEIVAEERGFENLQDYWNQKIAGFM